MSLRAFRLAAVAAAIASLSGCTFLGIDFTDDKVQYESSNSRANLEVPPDLTPVKSDDRFQVPARPGVVSANAEAERAAAEAAQEAERAAAQAAVAAEPANNFTEAADLVEEEDDETERMRAQVEEKFALPEADFAIDYTQWTVIYADSSTRDFDSAQGAFVA